MVILQMTLPFYISYYVVKGIHTLEDKRKSLNSIEENREDKQKKLNSTKENKEGNQKSKITEINNQTVAGEEYEVTK